MDSDERDPRDWPESTEEPTTPEEPAPAPVTGEEQQPEADAWAEPASMSPDASWPRADAPAEPTPETRPWPTEPPAPGSSAGWPTEAPERGEAPLGEPSESAATWGSSATEPSEPAEPIEPAEPFEPAEPAEPATGAWPAADAPTAEAPAWSTMPAETAEPAASTADWESAPAAEPVMDETTSVPPAEPAPSEIEAYPAAPPPEPPVGSVAPMAAAQVVPDAESATGESTQCPRCGTENRPGLAFCRNCGQRLVAAGVATTVERPGTPEGTMACPRCGTHNRAGVGFCQNCGANLRGTAPGYVPPAAAEPEAVVVATERGGAVLGPVVLLIGLVGLATGYLLPFLYGSGSLFDRAFGADGYGIAFWNGYPDVGGSLADQAYFGLAGPILALGLLVLVLAIAGFVRAAPGPLQMAGLLVALLWSVGLAVLFLVVEVAGSWGGDIVGLLRDLSPGGIIFFLASLIVVIGTLTRFGRG